MPPPSQSLKKTVIFCDGACSGNPGPGGWGAIILNPDGGVQELGGRCPSTTNNQMELTAAIEALARADAGVRAEIYTDSVYVIRGITQWIRGWVRNGWKTSEGNDVSNRGLWERLEGVVRGRAPVSWHYVRGHAGIPGNERVDAIAVDFCAGRPPELFTGPVSGYGVDLLRIPEDTGVPESKFQSGKKAAAHSYLSVVGNKPMRHASWAECERRVKGVPGAKFKKAASAADEAGILASWGFGPQDL